MPKRSGSGRAGANLMRELTGSLPHRLSDIIHVMSELAELPNLGPTIVKKLEAVGIRTQSELVDAGSIEAYARIKGYGAKCCNMLYALEGAIRGVRRHKLSSRDRDHLREEYASLK